MSSIHEVFQSDEEWFMAPCLDLPVTTPGKTLSAAKKKLRKAVKLCLETWAANAQSRSSKEVYLTTMEDRKATADVKGGRGFAHAAFVVNE